MPTLSPDPSSPPDRAARRGRRCRARRGCRAHGPTRPVLLGYLGAVFLATLPVAPRPPQQLGHRRLELGAEGRLHQGYVVEVGEPTASPRRRGLAASGIVLAVCPVGWRLSRGRCCVHWAWESSRDGAVGETRLEPGPERGIGGRRGRPSSTAYELGRKCTIRRGAVGKSKRRAAVDEAAEIPTATVHEQQPRVGIGRASIPL